MTYEQWCDSEGWAPTEFGRGLWQAACRECSLAIQESLEIYGHSSLKIKMATDMAMQACLNVAGPVL